jgi:hypothetical protein
MPKLVRASETAGCGATIELDSKEVVYVSIAQIGVLVRLWDTKSGFLKSIVSNFFGPQLYKEKDVYKNARTGQALALMFPEQTPILSFKNPVLAAFANAIWHCSTAAQVCTVLNEATAKALEVDQAIEETALRKAFDDAKNWPPKRSPEMTPATYRVIFSDGNIQENRFVPTEIESWAARCNKDAEGKCRILRILDATDNIVWGE